MHCLLRQSRQCTTAFVTSSKHNDLFELSFNVLGMQVFVMVFGDKSDNCELFQVFRPADESSPHRVTRTQLFHDPAVACTRVMRSVAWAAPESPAAPHTLEGKVLSGWPAVAWSVCCYAVFPGEPKAD